MICNYNTAKNIFLFYSEDRAFCCNAEGNKVGFPMGALSMQISKSPMTDEDVPFQAVRAACKFFNSKPSERELQNKAIKEGVFF